MMLPALLLAALQLADSVTTVTVRDGTRTSLVPIVFTRSGPLLRAADLLPPLGGRLRREPPDRLIVEVGGTRIEFTLGLPFARVSGQAAPLSAAPLVRDGDVFLPMALVSDILPRHVPGFSWDPDRSVVTLEGSAAAGGRAAVGTRLNGNGGSTGRPVSAPPPEAARPARTRPLVVVDAGHGGPDRGMSAPYGRSRTLYEKDVTLAVARRLRTALSAGGVDVLMTRTTDTLIALADRGRIANDRNATLFLSIHVNAANPRWRNPRGARGFETYFLSDAKTEDERRVAEMENEADRFLDLGTEPGDPLLFLLGDMLQNQYLRESSELATTLQAGLRAVHPSRNDRGVKQAGFVVLVTAHMPAVLIEIGFGTNAAEAAWLNSAKGQQQLADAIAKATKKYLADYGRRGGAAFGGR